MSLTILEKKEVLKPGGEFQQSLRQDSQDLYSLPFEKLSEDQKIGLTRTSLGEFLKRFLPPQAPLRTLDEDTVKEVAGLNGTGRQAQVVDPSLIPDVSPIQGLQRTPGAEAQPQAPYDPLRGLLGGLGGASDFGAYGGHQTANVLASQEPIPYRGPHEEVTVRSDGTPPLTQQLPYVEPPPMGTEPGRMLTPFPDLVSPTHGPMPLPNVMNQQVPTTEPKMYRHLTQHSTAPPELRQPIQAESYPPFPGREQVQLSRFPVDIDPSDASVRAPFERVPLAKGGLFNPLGLPDQYSPARGYQEYQPSSPFYDSLLKNFFPGEHQQQQTQSFNPRVDILTPPRHEIPPIDRYSRPLPREIPGEQAQLPEHDYLTPREVSEQKGEIQGTPVFDTNNKLIGHLDENGELIKTTGELKSLDEQSPEELQVLVDESKSKVNGKDSFWDKFLDADLYKTIGKGIAYGFSVPEIRNAIGLSLVGLIGGGGRRGAGNVAAFQKEFQRAEQSRIARESLVAGREQKAREVQNVFLEHVIGNKAIMAGSPEDVKSYVERRLPGISPYITKEMIESAVSQIGEYHTNFYQAYDSQGDPYKKGVSEGSPIYMTPEESGTLQREIRKTQGIQYYITRAISLIKAHEFATGPFADWLREQGPFSVAIYLQSIGEEGLTHEEIQKRLFGMGVPGIEVPIAEEPINNATINSETEAANTKDRVSFDALLNSLVPLTPEQRSVSWQTLQANEEAMEKFRPWLSELKERFPELKDLPAER